jgi:hypothetical protein
VCQEVAHEGLFCTERPWCALWICLVTGALSPILRFLMVMTIRDGQIVHSRDYTNPVTSAQLLGKIPELLAALGAGQLG